MKDELVTRLAEVIYEATGDSVAFTSESIARAVLASGLVTPTESLREFLDQLTCQPIDRPGDCDVCDTIRKIRGTSSEGEYL